MITTMNTEKSDIPVQAQTRNSGLTPQDFMRFLEDRKALDIVLVRLENTFADAMIVVTAPSRRAAKGLADAVGQFCHENRHEFFGMEGYELGEWILVDCNDVIINIFLEETRDLYKLEELWKSYVRPGKEVFK